MTQGTPWTVSQEDRACFKAVFGFEAADQNAMEWNDLNKIAKHRHEAQAELVEALQKVTGVFRDYATAAGPMDNEDSALYAKVQALLAKIGAGA